MDYLKLPKCPKMHLISPPGSPPLGWEQVEEDHPNPDPLAQDLHADAFVLPPPSHAHSRSPSSSPTPLVAAVSAKLAALSAFKSTGGSLPSATNNDASLSSNDQPQHALPILKLRSSTLGRPTVTTASPTTLMTARAMYTGSPAPDSPIDFSLGSPAVHSATLGMHQLWLGRSGSTSDSEANAPTLSPTLNASDGAPQVTQSPTSELAEPNWPVPLSNSPTAMSSLPPGAVTVIVPGISDAQHAKQRTMSLSLLSTSPSNSSDAGDNGLALASEDQGGVPMIVVQDHSSSSAASSSTEAADGHLHPQRAMSLPVPGRPMVAVPFPPSSAMSKVSSIPQTRLPPRTAASPKE
ncbi:hypothetical protein BCR44DRAFT_1461959 [Catenaria anguillulae PL171]|uniref:Uncharacterized protein n=1 Tax=Catenaria anguillulae PL171 TaxID=765915 RepID=A0A1Y2HHU4_9FUNG|nr:hypothetical protein BCR44DRAFT_1461959 [Catenaria anguillulae PL171]